MSASDYDPDHPILAAWAAFKATPKWDAVPTLGMGEEVFPVFEAGWNALRDMMEAAPVFFAESEDEVAQMLGNTLLDAGKPQKGKLS